MEAKRCAYMHCSECSQKPHSNLNKVGFNTENNYTAIGEEVYRWTENSKGHSKAEGRTNLNGEVVCGIRQVWSRCACSPADGREA